MDQSAVTLYRYRAARADGERVRGVVRADSPETAVANLTDRNLLVLEVSADGNTTARQLDAAALAEVFAGLAALLEAGLAVDRALEGVEKASRPTMRRLLVEVRAAVAGGASLAAALEQTARIPRAAIAALRAGEAQGRLADAVQSVARDLEQEAELRNQVRSALVYPAFLLVTGTVSVALIVGLVLPRFSAILGELDGPLPASTRLLFTIGDLATPRVIVVALTLVAAFVFAWRLAPPAWSGRWHNVLLAIPLLGTARRQLAAVRICRTLSAVIQAGVPILPALDLAADAPGDTAIGARVRRARGDVVQGARLSRAFAAHQVLTPRCQLLLSYGDESGRVAEFLARAAIQEDVALRRLLRGTISLVEPALIVAFGGAVALVALGLLQALYSVRPSAF